jgi:hypothetical protein
MYDLELAAAAASYMPGPAYSSGSVADMRALLSGSDNVHGYGTKASNARDGSAARKVLHSHFTGENVSLSAFEAAHIRSGAEFLAAHKSDFTPGFVKSAASMYAHVLDPHGRPVVDRRMFNTGRPRKHG